MSLTELTKYSETGMQVGQQRAAGNSPVNQITTANQGGIAIAGSIHTGGDIHFHPPASAAIPETWRLPLENRHFVERHTLSQALHAYLSYAHTLADPADETKHADTSASIATPTLTHQAPVALVAMHGLGGVGKTELAKHYLHHCRQWHHYSLRAWFRGDNRDTLLSDYRLFAGDIGLIHDTLDDAQLLRRLHTWLAQHPGWLIVIDNADGDVEALHPCLPTIGGQLILTSRQQAWQRHAHVITVDIVSPDKACEMLYTLSARNSHEESQTAMDLVERLGYLPLAIDQAASYIRVNAKTLAEYWDLFQRYQHHLLADTSVGTAPNQAVATTWLISLEAIEAQVEPPASRPQPRWRHARGVLTCCAYMGTGPIALSCLTQWLSQQLSAEDGPLELAGDAIISVLVNYALLSRDSTRQTVRMHPLMQSVLRHEHQHPAATPPATAVAHTPAFFHGLFSSLATDYEQTTDDYPAQYRAHLELRPHLQALQGYYHHLYPQAAPSPQEATILNTLAQNYYEAGDYPQVLHYGQQALAMWQRLFPGDHPDVASSLNTVGEAVAALGGDDNRRRGLDLQEQALTMHQRLFPGDHPDVARSLNTVGMGYCALGGDNNLRRGLDLQEQALAMRQRLFPGDHPDVARSLANVGAGYHNLGGDDNHRRGLDLQEQALAMTQRLFPGDHPDVATLLANVGIGVAALGGDDNHRRGLDLKEQALAMTQRLFSGDHPDVATSLANVGAGYHNLGGDNNLRRGLDLQEQALAMHQRLFSGDHPDVATSLANVGAGYHNLGGDDNRRRGLEFLEQALAMRQRLFPGDHPDVATSLNTVGLGIKALGGDDNRRRGLDLQEQALAMRQRLFSGDHPDVATSLANVGAGYHNLGGDDNLRRGLDLQEQALAMRQRLFPGDHPDVATSLNNVGLGIKALGGDDNRRRGLDLQEQALAMRQRLSGREL